MMLRVFLCRGDRPFCWVRSSREGAIRLRVGWNFAARALLFREAMQGVSCHPGFRKSSRIPRSHSTEAAGCSALRSRDGRPHDITVARSPGMGLDQKAIEAVRNWKFEPAMKDGQPVAVQINVEVNFRLY